MEGERGVCEREREEKNLRKVWLLRKKKKKCFLVKTYPSTKSKDGFYKQICIFVFSFQMQILSCFIVEKGKKKLCSPFQSYF